MLSDNWSSRTQLIAVSSQSYGIKLIFTWRRSVLVEAFLYQADMAGHLKGNFARHLGSIYSLHSIQWLPEVRWHAYMIQTRHICRVHMIRLILGMITCLSLAWLEASSGSQYRQGQFEMSHRSSNVRRDVSWIQLSFEGIIRLVPQKRKQAQWRTGETSSILSPIM